MTNIVKKTWNWDEKFNSTNFKLGDDINDLIKGELVISNRENKFEFFGVNYFPWRIDVDSNGLIESITFRERFFNFIKDDLWDMEVNKFIRNVDIYLNPKDNLEESDSLFVVFRGGFVAIAVIKRFKMHIAT